MTSTQSGYMGLTNSLTLQDHKYTYTAFLEKLPTPQVSETGESQPIPEDIQLQAWVDTVGIGKKGTVYGLAGKAAWVKPSSSRASQYSSSSDPELVSRILTLEERLQQSEEERLREREEHRAILEEERQRERDAHRAILEEERQRDREERQREREEHRAMLEESRRQMMEESRQQMRMMINSMPPNMLSQNPPHNPPQDD